VTDEQDRLSARLMARAQGGDSEAYTELLTLLASVGRRYVRRRVGGAAWVDDVVQETLLSVHAARHTFTGGRPFAPWFYAIASSRLIDAIRRERRIASREIADGPPVDEAAGALPGPAPRPALDPDAVRAAMLRLTPNQRRVVHALKFRHETVREASERLGMSQTAVKVTAHRGYRALRKALGMAHREH
jgi:RNA polymerase sigma-70 factor (ECF subfamily)